jgi:hypothetical protein
VVVEKSQFSQAEYSQTAQGAYRSARFSSISGHVSNFNLLFFEVVSSNVSFIFPKYFAAQKRHRRGLSTANSAETQLRETANSPARECTFVKINENAFEKAEKT